MNTSRSAQFTVIQGLFLEVGPAGRKVRSRIRVQWDEPMQWIRASAQCETLGFHVMIKCIYSVPALYRDSRLAPLVHRRFFLICVIFAISRNIVKK